MDNDNLVVCAFAVVIMSIIGALLFASSYSDYKVAEMVKAGADPLVAKCSVSPEARFCILVAAKTNE